MCKSYQSHNSFVSLDYILGRWKVRGKNKQSLKIVRWQMWIVWAFALLAVVLHLIIMINNLIQRHNSRFFTISSLRRKLSPTHMLKWPWCNCVQIKCNTLSTCHCNMLCYVPHGRKGQLGCLVWQSLNHTYLRVILLAEPLTYEGLWLCFVMSRYLICELWHSDDTVGACCSFLAYYRDDPSVIFAFEVTVLVTFK